MLQRPGRLPACLLIVASLGASCLALAGTSADPLAGCLRSGTGETRNDYRMRDSTPQMQWSVADVKRNHLDAAQQRMNAGEFSERVLADLDFILRHWPNHGPALEALIRYDLAGGRPFGYDGTQCYLARAQDFVPDDRNVMLARAYYFFKKGDKRSALAEYQNVLALDPESADAHYNLGLLYFEMSDFEKARAHARAAYAKGYPLPGLRRKLERAGQWDAPPTARAE
jgi:tetratricopeptide (TPR) repeat protein